MKHYLVMGRMCGDDEDCGLCVEAENRHDAVNIYVEDMWEVFFNDSTDSAAQKAEVRRLAEANGEDVFINGIYESETPIKEST